MRLTTIARNLCAAVLISLFLAAGGWAQQPNASTVIARAKTARMTAAANAKPPAAAPSVTAAAPAADPIMAANNETVGKRDPFAALINQRRDGSGIHLPPGKAGLVIATVRVDGTVRSGTAMIAIVSNPGNSVYFIREGDRLYDGSVEKIGLDGVTFREDSKDAFGHPIERTVTKRIYAIAGEQQ
jgi:hypothetical protein